MAENVLEICSNLFKLMFLHVLFKVKLYFLELEEERYVLSYVFEKIFFACK